MALRNLGKKAKHYLQRGIALDDEALSGGPYDVIVGVLAMHVLVENANAEGIPKVRGGHFSLITI